jgi:uncharacterized membrane protein
MILPLVQAADTIVTQFRWRSRPELWLVVLVIVPLVIGFVWWIYRREADTASPRVKRVMGFFRVAAILAVLTMLFEPYAETSRQRTVRANLVVLLDTSASMSFADRYADRALAERLRAAADLGPGDSLEEISRLDLVRGVLGNETLAVLDRLSEKFVLHVHTFDQELKPLWSPGHTDEANGDDGGDLRDRVRGLRPEGELSRIGDAVSDLLEEFRLRDEPLAAVVLVSDGRRHGGKVEPGEAAKKASALRVPVPVYTVVVGDPTEARNIQVSDLRAREVVLARDQVTFDFTVRNTGFEGQVVPVRLVAVSGADRHEEVLAESEVRLPADGSEAQARITHRFERSGSYVLRVGVPPQPGEKVMNDNFLLHPLRGIDRRLRVLYVEGYPRFEYQFLMNALIREPDTIEAQILLLDASPGYVQFSTENVPPVTRFPHSRRELMEYDVIIFGDVDPKTLSTDPRDAERDLENLRAFVEAGGGFAMISGEYDAPRSYRNTPLAPVLPIVIDPGEETDTHQDPERSTNLRLTPTGRDHAIMQLEDDPAKSRDLWEEDEFTAFFWYHAVGRAKEVARVLAVHPGESNRNRAGPHPIFATMQYVRGRVFWSAIDEVWRMRWVYEDHYYKRFWGEIIRYLATYKLEGGNRRFKIFTEDRYFVGDRVTIRASVLDADFEPSKAETQTVVLQTPDGEEIEIELRAEPNQPGNYKRVIRATGQGTYVVTVDDPALEGDRPEKAFRVVYSTGEMRDPLPDPALMASMAETAGGRTLDLSGMPDLAAEIPTRTLLVPTDIRPDDLWDSAFVLLLLAAILTTEWMLRKRFRLL